MVRLLPMRRQRSVKTIRDPWILYCQVLKKLDELEELLPLSREALLGVHGALPAQPNEVAIPLQDAGLRPAAMAFAGEPPILARVRAADAQLEPVLFVPAPTTTGLINWGLLSG